MTVDPTAAQSGGAGAWLQGIAAILAAVAWPVAISTVLLYNRKSVTSILDILVSKLSKAKRINIARTLEIEEEVAREIESETPKPARGTVEAGLTSDLPAQEKEAAVRFQTKVSSLSRNRTSTILAVRTQVLSLAREYDLIRDTLPPGIDRTVRMNEVVARMRTVSLAAKPLLKSLSQSNSPGRRLAATTILQMSPQIGYVGWLAERMKTDAPFVFFNAALALLEAVRKFGDKLPAFLRTEIARARATVESFQGGEPDRNTIDVLEQAQRELDAIGGRA